MQIILNNTDQKLEIIELENKIQKTKNLTQAVQMIIKNVQDNEGIRQSVRGDIDDFSEKEKNRYENFFISDIIKRLETECMDMMYNFLNNKDNFIIYMAITRECKFHSIY